MGWVMDLIRYLRRPTARDADAIRDEMTRTDPDFKRVREVQHDALNAITADQGSRDLRDRFIDRSRRSWRPDGAG